MKKVLSLILIAGVILGVLTLAACGNNAQEDMTSMMDDATTLMDEMSEDLSEALTDESTTEEKSSDEETTEVTTDVTTEIAVTDESTSKGDETTISGGIATE